MFRFEVYDIDKPNAKLEEQESIGSVECTLAQIVSAGQSGLSLTLQEETEDDEDESPTHKAEKKSPGTIILIAEELSALKDEVCKKSSHVLSSPLDTSTVTIIMKILLSP